MADDMICGRCHGTGRHGLDRELAATLQVVRRARRDVSASDVAATMLGVGHTAMCNRLALLERLGFVERVGRRGRRVYFRALAKVAHD